MNRSNSRTCGLKLSTALTIALGLSSFSLPAQAQESFASPEQAVDALIAANRDGDKNKLLDILGPKAEKLITSGDPQADQEGREKFLAAYDQSHALESQGDNKQLLVVGEENWPLPIPLVRHGDSWRFDTKAGEQEILNRRIGRNELNVIQVCRAYVDAQHEYSEENPTKNGQPQYAQHFVSSSNTHDGLYWPTAEGEKESPLGPLIVNARAENYSPAEKSMLEPYHGYYYKILRGQGAQVEGGTKSYIVKGHMTKGFALIAFPARYGDSGVMTFLVNQDGIVYEKDLGPSTGSIAKHVTAYDPDRSWIASSEADSQ